MVVVPLTVRSPVTVRLSLIVVSDVVCPIETAVPLVVPRLIEAVPEPELTASIVRAFALELFAVIVRLELSVPSMETDDPSIARFPVVAKVKSPLPAFN